MNKENLPGNRVEGLLDTNVGLCAGLQELDSKLVCKGLTLILGDHLWRKNKQEDKGRGSVNKGVLLFLLSKGHYFGKDSVVPPRPARR